MQFHEFYFVFLHKNHEFTFVDESTKNNSYKGHFEFQRQMMLDKKLLFSGPLDGTGGLYFFSTQTITREQLQSELQNDPLVNIGLFSFEIHKFSVPSFMIQLPHQDPEAINSFFTEVISSN